MTATSRQPITLANPISDTLLIPLYMRAQLTAQGSPILNDQSALALYQQLDYDFDKYAQAQFSLIGCGVRAAYFDALCQKAIAQLADRDDDLLIINLGCGLDDRYQRVVSTNDYAQTLLGQRLWFYAVDLPEVMTHRNALLPEKPAERNIAGSLLENAWLETILADAKARQSPYRLLVLIEGVLMYFKESVVQDFFQRMARICQAAAPLLSRSQWAFDATNALAVKNSRNHDALRKTQVRFQWAMQGGEQLSRWNPAYHPISCVSIMDLQPKQWHWQARLLRLFRPLRECTRIAAYELRFPG